MAKRPTHVSLEDLENAPLALADTTTPSSVNDDQWRERFTTVAEEKSQLLEEQLRLKEQISELKQKLNTKSILDEMLKPYAGKAFWFMCSYASYVGIVILMNGFGCFHTPIQESVMQFLVGSTAATVIGLVGMVLTGIFVGARK